MAYYKIVAKPKEDRIQELHKKLEAGTFRSLRPFGNTLTESLLKARFDVENNRAVWEEEDYCTPPLDQERRAVLDHYFEDIKFQAVDQNTGWESIRDFPSLWKEKGVVKPI